MDDLIRAIQDFTLSRTSVSRFFFSVNKDVCALSLINMDYSLESVTFFPFSPQEKYLHFKITT